MLDQADFIAKYDKENALGLVTSSPAQLALKFEVDAGVLSGLADCKQLVVAGMGGSAQPAEFIKTWLGDRLPVPLVIVRDYGLPGFVGPDTLVVASSYSGNTEETLAALDEAEKRGARVVVSCAGGKLMERARAAGYPLFALPADVQPRLSVPAAVKALATLVEAVGWAPGAVAELEAAGVWAAGEVSAWGADVPTADNAAKQIAEELVAHSVVVYSGPALGFLAMRWKIAINENAKNIAFYNYLPEMNHNEFIGWSHPENHGIKVIELRSDLDSDRVVKRFDVVNRLTSNRFAPIEVYAKGETRLQQMFWTLVLGDFVSIYLACLNGVDPTPVDLVEKFKVELG
jgi:glucose/mannose-6-phosphate isomerase